MKVYYIRFKAKFEEDHLYESGLLSHPFLKELNSRSKELFLKQTNIKSPLIFKSHISTVIESINQLNEVIKSHPIIVKNTFLLGEYSVQEIPQGLDYLLNKKVINGNDVLRMCIYIKQQIRDIYKSKNDSLDLEINILNRMFKDSDESED